MSIELHPSAAGAPPSHPQEAGGHEDEGPQCRGGVRPLPGGPAGRGGRRGALRGDLVDGVGAGKEF